MNLSPHSLGQRFNRQFRPGGKVFYGWWIVAAACGVQWLAGTLWVHSYGAYTVLLHEEFGWSMTALSVAFALTRVESGILGPLQGWLVDRYGPRVILTIGNVLFGLGFLWFSQIGSLLTFYLALFLLALGASLGGFFTLMVALVHWFDRHRTSAVAFAQMGFSLGGLSIPLLVFGLERYGWRTMAACSGVLILGVGLPLVQLVRHRPAQIGEHPDGLVPESQGETRQASRRKHTQHTWRQAVRTPSFWLLSAGHGLALVTVSTVIVHTIPHLTNGLGHSLAIAGAWFGIMTGCQLLGQFLGGPLGDRFNKRLLCVGCMIAHGVGLGFLIRADSLLMLGAFAAFYGISWGIRGPLMIAIRSDYFGSKSFGTITGISSLVVMMGMMSGPIFCGILVDYFGNYEIAFSAIATTAFLGSLCFWLATPPNTTTAPATALATDPPQA